MQIKRFFPFQPWGFKGLEKEYFLKEIKKIWDAIPESYGGNFFFGRTLNSREFAIEVHPFDPDNDNNIGIEPASEKDLIKVLGHLYRDRVKTGVHKYAPVYVEFC